LKKNYTQKDELSPSKITFRTPENLVLNPQGTENLRLGTVELHSNVSLYCFQVVAVSCAYLVISEARVLRH